MNTQPKKYKLFEVTGIELEYMVVDRDTLKVLPIVDKLFEDVTGKITSDVERGDVEWSNELVSHVVELKTAKPTKKIPSFRKKFASEVKLPQDNWWSFSRAFTASGLVYLSHQTSEGWRWPPVPLAPKIKIFMGSFHFFESKISFIYYKCSRNQSNISVDRKM